MPFIFFFSLDQFSSLSWWKAFSQHDAANIRLHCGIGVSAWWHNVAVFLFFIKQWLFFCHFPIKPYSIQLTALLVLWLVYLLYYLLIPFNLVCSFWWVAFSHSGAMFFPFWYNGLIVLYGTYKVWNIYIYIPLYLLLQNLLVENLGLKQGLSFFIPLEYFVLFC